MTERTARCCCGDTWIRFRGEPERVIVCHCLYCQRRTGSVLQVSAWFFEEQILARCTENVRAFSDSPNNPGTPFVFCLRCGSTVYWPIGVKAGTEGALADMPSGLYGVAVGCFEDPAFPSAQWDMNQGTRHHWVPSFGIDRCSTGMPVEYAAEFIVDKAKHLAANGLA